MSNAARRDAPPGICHESLTRDTRSGVRRFCPDSGPTEWRAAFIDCSRVPADHGRQRRRKSTVRLDVAPQFADVLEAAELAELGGEPQWTLEWRHQAVERAVAARWRPRRRVVTSCSAVTPFRQAR